MPLSTVEARRRRLARGARGAVALAVPLLLAALFLGPFGHGPALVGYATAAGGGGGGSGGSTLVNLTVNLTDRPSFDPAFLAVGAPATVNLTLINTGAINHTFTLVNRPNFVLNRSWSPGELNAYFAANGSQSNVTVAGGANTTVSLSFGESQVGFSFEFVSVVAYQFQAGMFGFLNVTGPPSGPGLVANVSASATQLAWLPDTIGINTSAFPVTIDMQVINAGSNGHTFWIAGQSNYTVNPGNFSAYFVAHPPLAAVTLSSTPGAPVWANFTISKAGIYEYICTVPGHLAGGMFGYLYVGVAVPAPPAAPSTELVSVWILYGGAGLLGIGALLAGAALLVGRFPRSPGGGH